MTIPVFVDNVYGTIASGIAATDLSITLTSGHGVRFPAVSASQTLYATLLNSSNVLEEIHITAHTANSDTLTVTRAANGTTAKAWSAGDRIECRLTSEGLDGFATKTSVQNGTVSLLGTVAGTDAITGVLTPTLTAYAAGKYVFFTSAGTNTGATTINIDSVGLRNIKKNSASGVAALVAGDMISGDSYLLYDDGTQFILMNPTVPVATQAQMEAATSNAVSVTPLAMKWNPGVAKVGLLYDGSAQSILASLNVSGVVRNATGDYTVSFTTAFSSASYWYALGAENTSGGIVITLHVANGGQLAGSIRLTTASHGNGAPIHASPADNTIISLCCFGDQ